MDDLEKSLKEINEYVKQCLWLDFSYEDIDCGNIRIIGSADLSREDYRSLEIVFEVATHISTILCDWKKPEDKLFIELASEEEAKKKFGNIADGYECFKINVEDYSEAPIWIVAKSLKYSLKR